METTEKIVEAYCRYVKNWFTLPNIKCEGQFEIDLLAIDITSPEEIRRFHIESSISISTGFSKLTAKPFSLERLRQRGHQAEQRHTIDFFIERKFNAPKILSSLGTYGFKPGNYSKVIVSWDWTPDADKQAAAEGILLWSCRDILKEIAEISSSGRTYFTDDTLRTLQLFQKATHNRLGKDDGDV